MKKQKNHAQQFVVCVNNTGYPASLELHKIYRVLPDKEAAKDGDLRVIDESGEDYLYPAPRFAEITVPRPVLRSLLHLRRGA
ncbi:MAG: hypothetical protein HYZ75_04490 [Elusimicrobia bacterium]|nr:hypothetical protein [Elusimicrobiota bacterium]